MAKRLKKMPVEQFTDVMARSWTPVRLEGEAVPEWIRGIPTDVVHSIYASGYDWAPSASAGEPLPAGAIIGGIDVYRHSPDDPVEINKDWYAVVVDFGATNMLLVSGPIRDHEHWIDEIPSRLAGAIVLGLPKKPEE